MLFAKGNTLLANGRMNLSTSLFQPNALPRLLKGGYACTYGIVARPLVTIRGEHTSPPAEDAVSPRLSTPSSQIHRHSKLRRVSTFLTVAVAFTAAGYVIGTSPTLSLALSRMPTDEESLTLFEPKDEKTAKIERQLQSHPLVTQLRANPLFEESRPHLKFPPATRAVSLTAGTLLGAERLVLPPLVFGARDGSQLVSLAFLGAKLCGHPGIIHGGLLAIMLDEGLAQCCFPALPNKIGVTASLKVNYRKPCPAGNFVVLRASTINVEGRKAWVKGRIESLVDPAKDEPSVIYAEAEALFVEPKFAASIPKIYSAK